MRHRFTRLDKLDIYLFYFNPEMCLLGPVNTVILPRTLPVTNIANETGCVNADPLYDVPKCSGGCYGRIQEKRCTPTQLDQKNPFTQFVFQCDSEYDKSFVRFTLLLKGLAQTKIIKNSVILFCFLK